MEIKINGNKIYVPLKDKELVLTPEEKVRQQYICRLVNDYGFSLEQMAQEVQVNNSQRGQNKYFIVKLFLHYDTLQNHWRKIGADKGETL